MIQAFWEVLKDLWIFLCSLVKGIRLEDAPEVIVASTTAQTDSVSIKPQKSLVGVIVPNKNFTQSHDRVAYVQFDIVDCLIRPNLQFDTRIESLLYGDKVSVNRIEGPFAEVLTSNGNRGWVETTALTDDVHQVFSNFKSGYVYGAKQEETIKLRRFLQDETLAHKLQLPLQSAEYVLYVLKRQRINVNWPPKRPREPGAWQSILRGVRGVAMSIEPHTKAIFEYVGDTGTPGFLGYVEAVHPDQSITIQSVGRVEAGEYRVEEFTQDVWKEWRPTFISFA